MDQQERPDAFLIAEDPALDFLNTICAPAGETIEWLADGRDLLCWLQLAGLLNAQEAAQCEAQPQKDLDAAAQEARDFREAFRMVVTQNAGQESPALDPAFVDRLNALLSRAAQGLKLERNSAPPPAYQLARTRSFRHGADLLSPLAEAAATLLAQPELTAVKQCEGPSCTLWFRDASKNRRRRWCVMSLCGNRAKATAFRQRRREEG